MTGGLPDIYDPEALTAALRAVEARLKNPAVAGVEASAAPLFPLARQATRLAVGTPSGTYGSEPDPRVIGATVERPGVAVAGWERFRIGPGLRLPLFWLGPIVGNTGVGEAINPSPWDVLPFVFGAFVVGIPHRLRRMPERWQPLSPSDDGGPIGQRCKVAGGTKWTAGTNFRVDVDFVPIFGRTPDAIELALKHLVGFAGTVASSTFGWKKLQATSQFFEHPDFQRGAAARMVTTDQTYSGLLITTGWGLSALAFYVSQGNAAFAIVQRYGSGPLGPRAASTKYEEDVRFCCPLPVLGKSIAAIYGDKDAPNTLDTLFSDGTRLLVDAGSVDWAVG